MKLLSPFFLLLLIPIPAIICFYLKTRNKSVSSILHPRVHISNVFKSKSKYIYKDVPFAFTIIALVFAIISLSRPVIVKYKATSKDGIYISLVLDVSPSMLGEDISPTRLVAAKNTLVKFVESRKFDKISLVSFAMSPTVKSPSTLDYNNLVNRIKNIEVDSEGSTSIGLGIATAVDILRNAPTEAERIIILLTDGDNNYGQIEPDLAAEIAAKYSIKIYTIGVGEPGVSSVWITYDDPNYGKRRIKMPYLLNEDVLIKIASITGGKYFNAKTSKALESVYFAISRLEKKPIEDESAMYYNELYIYPCLLSLISILIVVYLNYKKYISVP